MSDLRKRPVATPTLTITQGLPASGKSTWARLRAQGNANLGFETILVSRDDIRAMIHPQPWPYGDKAWEDRCTGVQVAIIDHALSNRMNVIAHDTNLRQGDVASWRDFASELGVELEIVDFTWMTVEACIERDAARPNPVGAEVIQRMHDSYQAWAGAGR